PVVGILRPGTTEQYRNFDILKSELSRIGFVEGKTVLFDVEEVVTGVAIEAAAERLVRRAPDVIFTPSLAARAVASQTNSIPIVFVSVLAPLARQLVKDIGHPGGNITGISQVPPE